MKRREYLIGAGTAGLGGIAGCSGQISPDMEFQNFIVPDPESVSADTKDEKYFTTIQNTGGSGDIRVELWFFKDSEVPNPSAPAIYQNTKNSDRYFDIARTRYFNEEERRELTIERSDNPPIQSEDREFGMIPWPASHGAVYKNTGSSGEVEFRFEYKDTRGYDTEQPSNKLRTVGEGENIEVVFDIVVPPGAEYEIVAEPK